MNSLIGAIVFGVSGIVFFIAGILTVKPMRLTNRPRPWVVLAAACFLLSFMGGYTAYLDFAANHQPGLINLVTMFLFLGGSGLLIAAIFLLAKKAGTDAAGNLALNSELERYRSGFEKVPFMVIIKDHQGTYLYTNPVYQFFLGKKGQNLVGETDFKFFPRAQALTFRQEEEKVLESGIPSMRDEEIRGVDGIRWIRLSRILLKEDDHGKRVILIAGQDITLQKQLENNYQGFKKSLEQLNDLIPDLSLIAENPVLLESITKWSGRMANTAHAGIWQVIPERSIAVLRVGTGKLSQLIGTQIKMGRDLPWKVWQTGQRLVVEKYQNWPERTPWIQDADFSSAVGIPIKAQNQPDYVLSVFLDKNAKPIEVEQLNLLNILINIAANRLQFFERRESIEKENQEWQLKLEKNQFKARIEHLLAVIATYFINVDLEKIDEGISRALETVVKLIGVERGYLFLFPKGDGDAKAISYSSHKENLSDGFNDLTHIGFQAILQKLNQLEIIYYPKVNTLSPERDEPAAYLQAKGIKSFTAIPLVSNRSLVGYLSFEAVENEVDWSQDILALLKNYGEMFVNLLDRKLSRKAAQDEQLRIQAQVNELEIKTQENALITEMGDLLQACRTADEAYPIIIRYMQKLIPICSGALYIIHNTKDPAENVAAWGNELPGIAEHELAINECWALRRGRIYSIADPESEPVCSHIKELLVSGYMCVPLIAQGELVGVLHLRMPKNFPKTEFSQDQQQLAVKIGEYIAIPLTNLKLRDELRSQAIRDPLTGLYNRRYMEETLEREIRRANRHATSVGIIMFDIDKLKPINDRFGHDAGDHVLKSMGRELLTLFRGEDVACRYGGDEFTIVLPEATLADVWRRAEQMRESIKRMDFKYDGLQIGQITLSIGVAAYPDHGATAERVLLACDAASYASKFEGGDRIMMGHKTEA